MFYMCHCERYYFNITTVNSIFYSFLHLLLDFYIYKQKHNVVKNLNFNKLAEPPNNKIPMPKNTPHRVLQKPEL